MILNSPDKLFFKGRTIIGLAEFSIVSETSRAARDLTDFGLAQPAMTAAIIF